LSGQLKPFTSIAIQGFKSPWGRQFFKERIACFLAKLCALSVSVNHQRLYHSPLNFRALFCSETQRAFFVLKLILVSASIVIFTFIFLEGATVRPGRLRLFYCSKQDGESEVII